MQEAHSHAVFTEANAYTVRMREGCAGGGKGPLISEDKSLTLGCSNDQTLVAGFRRVNFGQYASDDVAGTIKARDCKDATDLVAFAVRTANTGANGHGIAEDKAHTLDQAQGQAVAQLYENHGQDSRLNWPLEVAPTVAQKFGTGGNNTPLVEQGYTVRRLTPTECERLQGFPDGWTDIEGASDTGRYKALGNSVAVPCVTWIIGRIKKMGR